MRISRSQPILDLFPNLRISLISGEVKNLPIAEGLWQMTEDFIRIESGHLTPDAIRNLPPVKRTKDAYRLLGKDPNRYRVSAEAMLRRIGSGKGLYQINALVDCLNLVSITTGVTIGGFDLDKIEGELMLDIGGEAESLDAIGRGEINIDRLPVYRDGLGPIGSPTSDCTRTMIQLETTRFLMVVTDFFGLDPIEEVTQRLFELIGKYCDGKNLLIETD